ncbi:MAG: TlpA family protein disulfide reductase [Candidatus Eisenbacteria bacterium]|nr:TlpA family protein disulfide reductase [Candidatus Eisenbacteria bacterium]
MRFHVAAALVLVLVCAAALWRAELFTVARPGDRPRPLALVPEARRPVTELDVVLPAVPVGMERLRRGDGVLLVHYWAMWERHGAAQAAALDSLSHSPALRELRVAVVCFDPFPSVSRFVARRRLSLDVLLDGRGELRRALPCPSIPYTYVLDPAGRIAVAQAGEVDWFAPGTREVLRALLDEPASPREQGACLPSEDSESRSGLRSQPGGLKSLLRLAGTSGSHSIPAGQGLRGSLRSSDLGASSSALLTGRPRIGRNRLSPTYWRKSSS